MHTYHPPLTFSVCVGGGRSVPGRGVPGGVCWGCVLGGVCQRGVCAREVCVLGVFARGLCVLGCVPGGVPGGVYQGVSARDVCQGVSAQGVVPGGVYHVTYPIMHLILPVCCLHTNWESTPVNTSPAAYILLAHFMLGYTPPPNRVTDRQV